MTILLAVLLILLACALAAQSIAGARGYNRRLFFIGGLLTGPVAILSAVQAAGYAVADDVAQPEQPQEPLALPPGEPPALAAGVSETIVEPETAAVVHAPHTEPELSFSGESVEMEPWRPEPAPVVPQLDVAVSEDDLRAVLGDGEISPAPSLAERAPAPEDIERRKAVTDLVSRAQRRPERGERRSVADADADTAQPQARKRRLPWSKAEQQLEWTLGVGDEPIPPGSFTGGTCPHCHTESYADWHGWCNNCLAPFPVTVIADEALPELSDGGTEPSDEAEAGKAGLAGRFKRGSAKTPTKKTATASKSKPASDGPKKFLGMTLLPEKKNKTKR